jgi:phage terminase small subunit
MKCNAELNTRQKIVITYLLVCKTVKEAAQKAGVRLATVFKWLKDPVFKAELDRLREEVIADVADRLKVHCMKATEVLVDLMDSENEQIKRGSANDILNHTHAFIEMRELSVRLEALEKVIQERNEPWQSKDNLRVLNAI